MAKALRFYLRLLLPVLLLTLLLRLIRDAIRVTSDDQDGSNIRYALAIQPTLKIAKVSVMVNKMHADDTIMSRALQSHQVQNELYGYQHFIGNYPLVEETAAHKDRPVGSWTKIGYILHLLLSELNKPEEERLDWLFWFDADTVILNPNIRLDTFLPPPALPSSTGMDPSAIHLLIAINWNGINAGVFPIRVHPWSVAMLSAALAYPHFDPTARLPFGDQSALNETLYTLPAFSANWTSVPHRWFNSFPFDHAFDGNRKWIYSENMTADTFDDGGPKHKGEEASPWKIQKGDMCIHFAGSIRVRESWMGGWLDRAEKYLPDWSDAAHQKRLEKEAAVFWQVTEPKRRQEAAEAKRLADARPLEQRPDMP